MHKTSNSITRLLPRAVCWIGTIASIGNVYGNTVGDPSAAQQDRRYDKLENFFRSFGCPAPYYARDYVDAADTFEIDYRLLPAISLVESTCGLHQRHNNRWGWDSARTPFASVKEGLRYITRQLAHGRFYKNKTLAQKIHTYNPDPRYERKIEMLMRKIDDSTQPLAAADNLGVQALRENQ